MGSVVRQAGIVQAGWLRVQQAGCGAALCLAAMLGAAPALAQTGDPARDALFRQTVERPGDLAATLRFAKAARDANDPEAAVGALERAVFFAPGSSRAQYELARTLIVAAGDNEESPLIAESTKILNRTALLPDSGIAPLQALIYLNGRAHRNIDPFRVPFC